MSARPKASLCDGKGEHVQAGQQVRHIAAKVGDDDAVPRRTGRLTVQDGAALVRFAARGFADDQEARIGERAGQVRRHLQEFSICAGANRSRPKPADAGNFSGASLTHLHYAPPRIKISPS
jgi:hypothetical protein